MRLSIEVPREQHKHLKAAAALQGKSIKDYVLERTLPDFEEQTALRELKTFLKPRIDAVKRGKFSTESVETIFNEVEQEENRK